MAGTVLRTRSQFENAVARILADEPECDPARDRPRTRADCIDGPRPCPWVGCRYHLLLDVTPKTGRIRLNQVNRALHELSDTCALDVADRGAQTQRDVGALLSVTRPRIQTIERAALKKIGLRLALMIKPAV